jgi:SAM-dependent methyltransferase
MLADACRLCHAADGLTPVRGRDPRRYVRCGRCQLIQLEREFFLDEADERARYLSHQNHIDSPGYVAFLDQAVAPALLHLNAHMRGLDYGCGPSPTLSALLHRAQIPCDDYDPYFRPEPPTGPYDFVFATEVLEHFKDPAGSLAQIHDLLKPRGLLIVMTEAWTDLDRFRTWHYTSDATHVCFYHARTFDYIEERFGFERVFDDGVRVKILKRVARNE